MRIIYEAQTTSVELFLFPTLPPLVLLTATTCDSGRLSDVLDTVLQSNALIAEYPKWISEFSEVQDNRVLRDLIKYRIRQTIIRYSKVIATNRKAQLLRAEEILKLREENVNSDPSEENITKLDEAWSEY